MVKNFRPGGIGHLGAQPGTYLVQAYFDDNQVEVVRANVIGWQVSGERLLTPLVLDPNALTHAAWNVVHPDGRVECSDGRCWADVDDWIVEERRLCREKAEPLPVRRERPAAQLPESNAA